MPAQFAAGLGIGGHVVELNRVALTGESPVAMPRGRPVREHQQRAIHRRHLNRVVSPGRRSTQQAQAALVLRPRAVRRVEIEQHGHALGSRLTWTLPSRSLVKPRSVTMVGASARSSPNLSAIAWRSAVLPSRPSAPARSARGQRIEWEGTTLAQRRQVGHHRAAALRAARSPAPRRGKGFAATGVARNAA